MPIDARAAGQPELVIDVRHGPLGDVKEPVIAQATMPGDRCLDKVPDAVKLVTPIQISLGDTAFDDFHEAIEVAIRALRGSYDRDRLVGGRR